MSGRVLHDAREVRVVELSTVYDHYSAMPVRQTVVVFNSSDWRPEVTLARPDGGEITQFTLTFEELNTLISVYQQLLTDREKTALERARSVEQWDEDLDDLDNHPF